MSGDPPGAFEQSGPDVFRTGPCREEKLHRAAGAHADAQAAAPGGALTDRDGNRRAPFLRAQEPDRPAPDGTERFRLAGGRAVRRNGAMRKGCSHWRTRALREELSRPRRPEGGALARSGKRLYAARVPRATHDFSGSSGAAPCMATRRFQTGSLPRRGKARLFAGGVLERDSIL